MNDPQPKRLRPWLVAAVLSVAAACLWVTFQLAVPPVPDAAQPAAALAAEPAADGNVAVASVPVAQPFLAELGIEVAGVNLAVGGTRLNVRYVVLDADRAVSLTNRLYSAYLLDGQGKPLRLPSGPEAAPVQNQSGQALRAGYIYSHFFPNPDHAVHPGDHVTLVIGDLRQKLLVR